MGPTSTWLCDTCRQAIKKPSHGIIEWLRSADEHGSWRGHGLRLVHHPRAGPPGPRRCGYHYFAAIRKDTVTLREVPLPALLGPDGLAALLSMLARDEAPKGELLELVKRLHIPGYEHARPDIDRAIACGVFTPAQPDGCYTQADIEATLEFARAAP